MHDKHYWKNRTLRVQAKTGKRLTRHNYCKQDLDTTIGSGYNNRNICRTGKARPIYTWELNFCRIVALGCLSSFVVVMPTLFKLSPRLPLIYSS